MIAVPASGPVALDVTFDDTRVAGTIKTGASGAYVGDAQGSLLGGSQLNVEASLSGPGCPEGLTVTVLLNLSTGKGTVTFHLNGGAISGPATLTRL